MIMYFNVTVHTFWCLPFTSGSTHNDIENVYFSISSIFHIILCVHVIEVNQVTLYILFLYTFLKELHL